MTFTKLKCPNTPLYQDTKKFILTGDFAWYYKPTTVVGTEGMDEYNLDGWYSHELLSRPKFGTIGNAYFLLLGQNSSQTSIRWSMRSWSSITYQSTVYTG